MTRRLGAPSAVVYLRTASRAQADHGAIARQHARCLKRAASLGVEVIEAFEDRGCSGIESDRPGLNQLLNYVGMHRVPYVIVENYARLARCRDLHEHVSRRLHEHGCAIVAADASSLITNEVFSPVWLV